MSLQPEIARGGASGGSADASGGATGASGGVTGASGRVTGASSSRVLPAPQITAIREEPTRRFSDIENEAEDVQMPEEPRTGQSKRKRSEEENRQMVVDDNRPAVDKSTKEVKRRRLGEGSAAAPAPRPPPIPTDIELDPPCDRCRRKALHCVAQLAPDEEDDPKGKKKRTACYECAKGRNGCTQQGQGSRPGRKRKTAAMVENSEEDELDGESLIPASYHGLTVYNAETTSAPPRRSATGKTSTAKPKSRQAPQVGRVAGECFAVPR